MSVGDPELSSGGQAKQSAIRTHRNGGVAVLLRVRLKVQPRRTDQLRLCCIKDQVQGRLDQTGVAQRKPEKSVGIQQQPHGMESLNSARCSSSSATIINSPRELPK